MTQGVQMSAIAWRQAPGYDTPVLRCNRNAAGYPKALTSHQWLAAELLPAAQRGRLPPFIIPGHVRSARSVTVWGVTFTPSTAKETRLR